MRVYHVIERKWTGKICHMPLLCEEGREARARQGEASIEEGRPTRFAKLTTPARQLLLSCRATPPLRGGECCYFLVDSKEISEL